MGNDLKHTVTLISPNIVDALSDFAWLTNLQRIEIADALLDFVAELPHPDEPKIAREALRSAELAISKLDADFKKEGLTEISGERMALRRAALAISDLANSTDPTRRHGGSLGWRKNEYRTAESK